MMVTCRVCGKYRLADTPEGYDKICTPCAGAEMRAQNAAEPEPEIEDNIDEASEFIATGGDHREEPNQP